jgi:hypothetical protein
MPPALVALFALRALSLYLLSLLPAASALLAWLGPDRRAGPLLLALSVLLASAQVAGEATALLGERWRGAARARAWLLTSYVGFVLISLAVFVGAPYPGLFERAAFGFSAVQMIALALPALASGHLLTLANALQLTVLAGFRGGAPAAVATIAFVSALVLFLSLDHATRRAESQPRVESTLVAFVVRRALGLAIPAASALAVLFALVPPTAHAGLAAMTAELRASREQIAVAYSQLSMATLVGTTAVYYASRALRRKSEPRPLNVEAVQPELVADQALEERPRRARRQYTGARGAIIRAYVGALRQAVASGFKRRPEQTPLEIASALTARADALPNLTRLFMDARYGSADPASADVATAESLAAQVASSLQSRRPTRNRP